jgi:phospholipid/cholesterol/gamma-HCH transport system ATP-binding protein
LARAIIRDPKILLYDEPTSGLDPVMSRHIDHLIVDLQKKYGVTSVVVTHDLHSAFTIGDRIAMLHAGQVIEIATPTEFIASKHECVQEFIKAQFSMGKVAGVII